ncbi:unnamed protein product [Cuscuta epithymum]|uniref:NAC domain-containing protein n=1 Tax=Cuscuta epithymum TaxID=186058 RepID=A0AAV0D7V5_9ASTE|nr:unnamed protein product [Cuscuta epithymum]
MASATLAPGFRFHPTDVELIMYYLKGKVTGRKFPAEAKRAITELNICHYSPWDLPDKSTLKSKDREWYFYCQREKKYAIGSRTKRATDTGYWKATGNDRIVKYEGRTVGMIKTLVFYQGHPPKGKRTDWVIHEYRMEDPNLVDSGIVQDTYVICKVFEKPGSGPKNGSQYGVFKEEDWEDKEACGKTDFSGASPAIDAHIDCQSSPVVTSAYELDCTSKFSAVKPTLPYAENGLSLAELTTNEVQHHNAFPEDTGLVPTAINSNENFSSMGQARGAGIEQCNVREELCDGYGKFDDLFAGLDESIMNISGSWAAAAPVERPANTAMPLQDGTAGGLDLSDIPFDTCNSLLGGLDGCEEESICFPGFWAPAGGGHPHNDIQALEGTSNHNLAHPDTHLMNANYMELDDLMKPLFMSQNYDDTTHSEMLTDYFPSYNSFIDESDFPGCSFPPYSFSPKQ